MKNKANNPNRPEGRTENRVCGGQYRFTILTPQIIRMEYDSSGRFEDRGTQSIVNRDFGPQEFSVYEKEDQLEIITEAVHLIYDKKDFSKYGLVVKVKGNFSVYHSVWHYSQDFDDLKGTARTLDNVDGATQLERGVLSRKGFSVIDDSASFILTEDGWVQPREDGDIKDLYFLGYGRNYKECLKDFYKLTGETPLLPRYALGNWWSRFYRYTEHSYKALIERFESEGLPFTVSVLDMDWHLTEIDPKYGSGWTGYSWNKALFPDPKSFMSWLHDKGLKITLNVHPADGVRAHEDMYLDMAKELGVDYENEVAIPFDGADRDFLKAYFKYLHHTNEDEGVDFWWIDWQQGNHSKVKGLDPLWMLNHYHYLDHMRKGKRGMIFSRYAGIGSHRYPIGFSGDTIISWDSLAFQPYFTANASNIGYSWWSHDIGGHMKGGKDDELATRWLQFGVFSPIMRLHSSCSEFNSKEPWRYEKNAFHTMKTFLRLRHQMLPYLYTMNGRSSFEGEPLVQPMYYQTPDRQEAYEVPNQYYFGSELIVAPITTPVDQRLRYAGVKTWLPPGYYIDFFTGTHYTGDRFLTMYRPLSQIPVLAKAGAIVPMLHKSFSGNDITLPKALEVRIFAGDDGAFSLYEDDGESLDYQDGICTWTDMNLNWKENPSFVMEPARGKVELLPAHRSYDLKFIGFKENKVNLTIDDVLVPCEQGYDPANSTIYLHLEDVPVDGRVQVRFENDLEIAPHSIEQNIFEFLDQAQLSFALKDQLFAITTSRSGTAKKLSDLIALNLDENVFNCLCEFILATL